MSCETFAMLYLKFDGCDGLWTADAQLVCVFWSQMSLKHFKAPRECRDERDSAFRHYRRALGCNRNVYKSHLGGTSEALELASESWRQVVNKVIKRAFTSISGRAHVLCGESAQHTFCVDDTTQQYHLVLHRKLCPLIRCDPVHAPRAG